MKLHSTTVAVLIALTSQVSYAADVDPLKKAFVDDAKVNVNFRLRYEHVDLDGVDATPDESQHQTTFRTRLTYQTGNIYNLFALAEVDDVRSSDNENLIGDYKYTQINQGFLGYRGPAQTLVKFGRQRIILDNQRFVGGVGFRQNEQTYDAVSVTNTLVDNLTAYYAYVDNVNRIFPEGSGIESHENKTNLVNINYKGWSFAKITGYAYLIDNMNVAAFSTDTYGVRVTGAHKLGDIKLSYGAEYATQSNSNNNTDDYDADYHNLSAGINYHGFGAKVGYEVLGAGGANGFVTPLATLHAFNGWTDKFLFSGKGNWENGIADTHAILTASVSGLKLMAKLHQFKSDAMDIDMGREWGLQASYPIAKYYSASVKYAQFSGADSGYSFSRDTDKLWLTLGAKF